jgi:hypothetical protein
VEDANVSSDNVLMDQVEIDLNMLGAFMPNRVSEEVDHIDVVAVDQCGL